MFSRRHLTASRELAPAFSRRHQVCKCKITRLCERNLFMDLVHRLGAPLKEMSPSGGIDGHPILNELAHIKAV